MDDLPVLQGERPLLGVAPHDLACDVKHRGRALTRTNRETFQLRVEIASVAKQVLLEFSEI